METSRKRVRADPGSKTLAKSRTSANYRRRYTRINRQIGFPARLRQTLKYVDHFTITSAAPATTVVHMQANNLFSIRSGGHQPMYFDVLMGLYNHYVVHNSRIKLSFAMDGAALAPRGGIAAVYLNDNVAVVPTDILGIAEQTSSKCVQNAPISNRDSVHLYSSYSAYKIFGPNAIQNVELKGDVGANCADTVVYSVCYETQGTATTSSTVTVLAEIEYDAEFFELKDQLRN